MSEVNENPEKEKDGFLEEKKENISKAIDEKKDAISKEISETKAAIGSTIDSGVKKTKSFFRKLFLFAGLALVVAGILYMVWANWTYSEGTRTGYLMKLSKKGYVFKTHEGQLNLGGLQDDQTSILGNTWNFSLTDHALVEKLEELEGKKVMLRYEEINKSMPWQGDTNYYITGVEEK